MAIFGKNTLKAMADAVRKPEQNTATPTRLDRIDQSGKKAPAPGHTIESYISALDVDGLEKRGMLSGATAKQLRLDVRDLHVEQPVSKNKAADLSEQLKDFGDLFS